jgi:ABC-2 type transport system permease protein
MTSITLDTQLPPAHGRAGFGGALRSEWTKISSLRSTVVTLLATMAVTIGLSTLFAWGATHRFTVRNNGHIPPAFDVIRGSLFGLIFGQLVIAVIGAMTITGEHGTHMIQTSLSVQPRRMVTLSAKLTVFTAVALVTGLVSSFASFLIGQRIFSSLNAGVGLGAPNALRAVIGGALFLTVAGLLAFGLGTILRHTAGAITAAVGVLFITLILYQFLPDDWAADAQRWIPFFAGSGVWTTRAAPDVQHVFGPWVEFAIFAGYAVVAVVVGAVMFRRRDA